MVDSRGTGDSGYGGGQLTDGTGDSGYGADRETSAERGGGRVIMKSVGAGRFDWPAIM